MKFYSIAIDGPAGAGKSTLSKLLAKELGFMYVDTGAIYRTVGYYINLMGIGSKDTDGVRRLIDEVNIDIFIDENNVQRMILNGQDVTDEIRTPEMSKYASDVSAMPFVRSFLLDMQRDLARKNNVIMDGRDIGTVVLPDADLKIFLTASAEERARRRYEEYVAKGEKTTLEKVLSDINQRDFNDSNRKAAPLKKAADAIEVDTTGETLEQSEKRVIELVRERLSI